MLSRCQGTIQRHFNSRSLFYSAARADRIGTLCIYSKLSFHQRREHITLDQSVLAAEMKRAWRKTPITYTGTSGTRHGFLRLSNEENRRSARGREDRESERIATAQVFMSCSKRYVVYCSVTGVLPRSEGSYACPITGDGSTLNSQHTVREVHSRTCTVLRDTGTSVG